VPRECENLFECSHVTASGQRIARMRAVERAGRFTYLCSVR
jgi:hypothetical protein